MAPESLARFHGRFFGSPLEIHNLELTLGSKQQLIQPNQEVEINPSIPVKISRLDTNRWQNYDLRYYSPDFDVELLTTTPKSLLSILGEKAFLDPKVVTILIKENGQTKATFILKAGFSVQDWIIRGDQAVEDEQKIGYYRKALELDPDSEVLFQKLSETLSSAGLNTELTDLLELKVSKSQDNETVKSLLVRLLKIYQETKNQDKEIDTLERLLSQAKKDGQPTEIYKNNLAIIYKDKNPDKSAALYEDLLTEANPEHKVSYLSELAILYHQTSNTVKEIDTFERLLDVVPAEQIASIWIQLISLREKIADLPGQRTAWENLAEVLPSGQEKANAYKHLAYLWYENQDLEKAEKAYLVASEQDPKDPSVFLNLAQLNLAKGDKKSYINNLEKSLALEDSPAFKRELALAYEDEGQTDKALTTWETLAGLPESDLEQSDLRLEARASILRLSRPENSEITDDFEKKLYLLSDNSLEFYNLGIYHFKQKKLDKALTAFIKALELDRDRNLVSDVRGYLLAIYKENGQTNEMLAQAMLLFKEHPDHKEYRDLIIEQYERTKNWTNLLKAATDWTNWYPKDPDNWRFLAMAQKNLGKGNEAAKSLLKAAESEPTQAKSWLSAADALEKAGEKAKAKTAYQKVIDLEPSNEKAEAALLRLALDSLPAKKPTTSNQ